ncbi:hypothetical protein [Spiroplasma culicicola]|uniref:ABC transporter permease n=1 Tax=Spiroplasma culicicola AES-1 TaxID=1276246 RepID=W6A694_9MOLU|nr:hypothetical protein [Spiroplasma culicicola]AHI52517.1 ABC transporter permease [Spiroplasma culicicola AES-1]
MKFFNQLIYMQWKKYWKQTFNIFSGTLLSIIIVFLWMVVRIQTLSLYDPYIFASSIAVISIRNGTQTFVTMVDEIDRFINIKTSYLTLKNRFISLFSIIIFNQIINLINILILLIIFLPFKEIRSSFNNINWSMTIGGYVLLIMTANVISYLLIMIIKKNEFVRIIIEINYFLGVYLVGLVVPYELVYNHKTLVVMSYFVWYRYATNIFCSGYINATNFDFEGNNIHVDFGYNNDNKIAWVVAALILVLIIIMIVIIKIIKHNKIKSVNKRNYKYMKKQLFDFYNSFNTKKELEAFLKKQAGDKNE